MRVDQYPLGNRVINPNSDFILGIVGGKLADIPINIFLSLVPSFAFSGGPTANRPVTPVLYQTYFDTDRGYAISCKQVSPAIWVNSAGVPV